MALSENATIAEKNSLRGQVGLGLSPVALEWFRKRGISQTTLDLMPVASGSVFYPDDEKKHPSAIFRFQEGWKARSIDDTKLFVMGKGHKRSFWNLEEVLAGPMEDVFLVEGELDALALVEAGVPYDQVLSTHGASDKPGEGPVTERPGYAYVIAALDAGLRNAKRFIWCGDEDPAGYLLREDMCKLLHAGRFNFVEWPTGCKDANDVLLAKGPQALLDHVLRGWRPWPVAGLYRLSELPEPAPMTLWEPGFPEWESKVRLAPRCLSVVTGHPGHGKTLLMNQAWFNVIKRYEVPMALATFETKAKPHARRQLRTLFANKLEFEMTDDEIRAADDWIEDRYFFMEHPEGMPTIGWFLDTAEIAVYRHNCRIIQADPWNRFEGSRPPGMREDEFILKCLRELYKFATTTNTHVQIIAHPAKMDSSRMGQAPSLEDIAGAKHWDNIVDQGFTVHRPKMFEKGERKTGAYLFHRKARFEQLGYPCRLSLDYNIKRGRYEPIDYDI